MAYKYFANMRNPHYRRLRRKFTKKTRSKRPYRSIGRTRRSIRKPQMSKRRILDVTTVKKRDNMASYSNMVQTGPGTDYAIQPAIILGNTSADISNNHPTVMVWNSTARDLTNNAGVLNIRASESARTSTTPYMVGLREIVEIQNNTGLPWQWRRICFTYKGLVPGLSPTTTFRPYQETSSGYTRVVNQLAGNRNTGATYDFFFLLFAGQNASDWQDPMVAKVDQTRVSVKYDKTRSLASGNEQGFIRKYKHWHQMGKTLAYDDDENGENMITNYTSVDSKIGMGDYYVVDMFRSRFGAASGSSITFNPSATLYWHEK